ncbi:deoxyribose-phosphate aldolase [Marinicrinis lubricantis]|uniref:Deoxyribose-phosphate aldolase n=1 Tax=Marinicrinis lubricantis TaxID=2086470 RepID=A0ABW1IV89_9BACL
MEKERRSTVQLAKYIDHTLLKPDAAEEQIRKLVREAQQYQFASVCVNPRWVKLCAQLLADSPVKVCTVIGFPLGAASREVKAFETQRAILDGAEEVDMVISVGDLKSGNDEAVKQDIHSVVETAQGKAIVKVIIETSLLTDAEKKRACELAVEAGADFVKTSTGFSGGGATVEDIRLMRLVVGERLGVKASGGVRTAEDALKMIEAGATRIGTSAGTHMMNGEASGSSY